MARRTFYEELGIKMPSSGKSSFGRGAERPVNPGRTVVVQDLKTLARGCWNPQWPGRCDKHPVSGTPEECWRCMGERLREMSQGFEPIKIVPMSTKWKEEILECARSLRS